MLKIIKINEIDFTAKGSISIFVAYKNLFNREFVKDLKIIENLDKEFNFGEAIEILEKMIYAFLYNANRQIDPFGKWKEKVGEFDVFETFKELQELIEVSANSLKGKK